MAKCSLPQCKAELLNPFICSICHCEFCNYKCLFECEAHTQFCGKLIPTSPSSVNSRSPAPALIENSQPLIPVTRGQESEGAATPKRYLVDPIQSVLEPPPASGPPVLRTSCSTPPFSQSCASGVKNPQSQPKSFPTSSPRSPPRMISPTGLAPNRHYRNERSSSDFNPHIKEVPSSRFNNFNWETGTQPSRSLKFPPQNADIFSDNVSVNGRSGDFSRSTHQKGDFGRETRFRPKSCGNEMSINFGPNPVSSSNGRGNFSGNDSQSRSGTAVNGNERNTRLRGQTDNDGKIYNNQRQNIEQCDGNKNEGPGNVGRKNNGRFSVSDYVQSRAESNGKGSELSNRPQRGNNSNGDIGSNQQLQPKLGQSRSGSDSGSGNSSNSPVFDVSCLYKEENNKYLWVIKTCDQEKFNRTLMQLSNANLRIAPPVEPAVGKLYATEYDNEWARCQVLQISPLAVHFIDYGNLDEVKPGGLRQLPPSLENIPGLAFPIKFADQQTQMNLRTEFPFKVKQLGNEGDVMIVELVTQPGKRNGQTTRSEVNANAVTAVVPKKIANEPPKPIVSMGSSAAPARIVHSPPATTSKCVEENTKSAPTGPGLPKETPRVAIVAKGLRFPSESLVYMEVAFASNGVFISCIEDENFYSQLNRNLNETCSNYRGAPSKAWDEDVTGATLLELPPVDAVLLGEFDGCFYRGKILQVQGGQVKIHFLDFGNETQLDLSQIRTLCKKQREFPPAVISVKLKGVPDVPYISVEGPYNAIINARLQLTLVYDGNGSDGVELHASNESINELICNAIATHALKNQDAELIVQPDSYSVYELNEGECEVMVTYWNEEEPSVVYCANTENGLFKYLLNELPMRLLECYDDTIDPYMPHEEELCAVYHNQDWGRASCVGQNRGKLEADMLFIDSGMRATVPTEFIRPLQKEFKNYRAAANQCFIVGDEMPQSGKVMRAVVTKVGTYFNIQFLA